MTDNGLSLNQWPVGTGPFMMTEYVQRPPPRDEAQPQLPRRALSLRGRCRATRRRACSPTAARRMPFIDTLVFTIEKDKVPLQGASSSRAISTCPRSSAPSGASTSSPTRTTPTSVKRAIRANAASSSRRCTDISDWYLGFNWLDPVVGKGDTPEQQAKNRKLRQALSIAIDWEEGYGRIFRRRPARPRTGPCRRACSARAKARPTGINPVTHKMVNGKIVRRSIDEAKSCSPRPATRTAATPRAASRWCSTTTTSAWPRPSPRPSSTGWSSQFAKLGVQLEVRATDYNQFQDKMLQGQAPDLLVGLARRLSRRRELPVPALRAERQVEVRGRERRELREPRVRQALPRAAGCSTTARQKQKHDRRDGGHRAAGCALGLRLLPLCGLRLPAVGLQRQAGRS